MSIELINSFGRDLIFERAVTSAGYFEGVKQDPTIQTFPLRASVQPASANELQILPEGTRTKETIKLYTVCELFTDDGPMSYADRIDVEGQRFKVVQIWNYRSLVGSPMSIQYFKVLAQREMEADDAAVTP